MKSDYNLQEAIMLSFADRQGMFNEINDKAISKSSPIFLRETISMVSSQFLVRALCVRVFYLRFNTL